MTAPKLFQFNVHFRHRDGTALNVDQAMFVPAVKSHYVIFTMHGDPIAISIRVRRWNDRAHGHNVEMRDAP